MELTHLIINGTTRFSSMIASLIELEGIAKIVAFTTKRSLITDESIDGKRVVPFEDLCSVFDKNTHFILNTIGYSKMNTIRERVNRDIEQLGFRPFSYISKRAFVSVEPDDLLSKGCIIMPNAFVGTNVIIGESVVIYNNCSLTHDIVIEDNSFIASGCVIGGNVVIGRNSFVGMNSTIKNRVHLAPFSLVGCGSNVIKSIDEEKRVIVGNPARILEIKDSLSSL